VKFGINPKNGNLVMADDFDDSDDDDFISQLNTQNQVVIQSQVHGLQPSQYIPTVKPASNSQKENRTPNLGTVKHEANRGAADIANRAAALRSNLNQSRQIQVPKQSEEDKKHFEPKFDEKEKELKALKLEKVEIKKKNACLIKLTKDVKREIEELEKRKKTVEKFSVGSRQFAAVRDSALKSNVIVSSQASTIRRNDSQDATQPAEKRIKTESETKNALQILKPRQSQHHSAFLKPQTKVTPRQSTKSRPNLRLSSDVSALFEENERSQVPAAKPKTSQTPTQNTQSSNESSQSSYGYLSLKDLSNFTVWLDDDRGEDLANDCLNSTLAAVPPPKETPTPPKSQMPTQASPKKVIKKHREIINEFSKAQKRKRNIKKSKKFGNPRSKPVQDFKNELLEMSKVVPHRVQPIKLPKFPVGEERISYDYFDMTIQKSPKWLRTEKCIPPKRFGSKSRVVAMNSNITSMQKWNHITTLEIERMVISEKSIIRSEFVENLFGRILEFTKLISEDNHKCYLYYFKDFYQLLESAKKAIHASPAKIIPEITIYHWKTVSKLSGCLVTWLEIRTPTVKEKITLVCNVLKFLEAIFSDQYSFLIHPLPKEVPSHNLPACLYRDIFFEIQKLTMFIDKNYEYSRVLPSLLGLAINYDSVYFHRINDLIIAFESKRDKDTLRAAALGKFYEDYTPVNWGLLYEFIRITDGFQPIQLTMDKSRTTLQMFFDSIDLTEKHQILNTLLAYKHRLKPSEEIYLPQFDLELLKNHTKYFTLLSSFFNQYCQHLEATELPHQTKCYFFVSIYERLHLGIISGRRALSQSLPDNNESQKTMKKIQTARTELEVIIKQLRDNLKEFRKKYYNQSCQLS